MSLLFLSSASSRAESIYFTQYNTQAHLIFPFQVVFTGSTFLERLGVSHSLAFIPPAFAMIAVQYFKQDQVDYSFSHENFIVNGVGVLAGTLAFLLWPGKDSYHSWLQFEPEFGGLNFIPIRVSNGEGTPPPTFMLHAQTTFWIKRRVGLHLFSGGATVGELNFHEYGLILGGGLRVPIFPWIWREQEPEAIFTLWAGVDSGLLLFSLDDTTPYLSAASTFFYSLGVRWRPFASTFHLGGQVTWAPYAQYTILGSGLQLGITF